jgi:hypothetical protein
MAIPTSKATLKDYCLRRIGAPISCINVTNDQIDDRIDDTLLYYQDYHFDGTEQVLYKHIITAEDIANKYITVPNNIIGISDILDFGDAVSSSNLFNIRYQIHLNDLFDLSASSFVPYVMAMTHISMLEEVFVGKKLFRYNRHVNKLHIDMDWDETVLVGAYMIIKCYRVVDPDTYTDVWGDRWIARYATALIKRQWAENIQKFQGIPLPGGISFNSDLIFQQAQTEIDKLEEDMLTSYSIPVTDLLG